MIAVLPYFSFLAPLVPPPELPAIVGVLMASMVLKMVAIAFLIVLFIIVLRW